MHLLRDTKLYIKCSHFQVHEKYFRDGGAEPDSLDEPLQQLNKYFTELSLVFSRPFLPSFQ